MSEATPSSAWRGLATLVLLRSRGKLLKWLRLVKQPKYLVGFLAFVAWNGWFLFGRLLVGGPRGHSPFGHVAPETTDPTRMLVAMGVAAFVTMTFLLPSKQPLAFDESEIQQLFPAPIPRRALIRYALLKVQPTLLFGSFVSVMVFGRGAFLARAARWPAVWGLFTAWFLVANAQGLWKARLRELPRVAAWRRRIASWIVAAAWWIAVLGLLTVDWSRATGQGVASQADFMLQLRTIVSTDSTLQLLLLPVELPLRALLVHDPLQRAGGFAALALLVVVLLEWCARSKVAFEDAAVENAQRISDLSRRGFRALQKKASPGVRRRRPFPLAPVGVPEIAVLWKNMLLVGRTSMARVILWGALVLLGVQVVTVALGAPLPIVVMEMTLGLTFAALLPIMGGATWRNDFRIDLLHVDRLRTWPIAARRLVAAEVAGPSLATALCATWCLGLAFVGATAGSLAQAMGRTGVTAPLEKAAAGMGASQAGLALSFLLTAIPFVAAASALSCALQNVSVLVLPGWTRLGPRGVAGAAVSGQQILLGLARLIAIAVGLVPGGLVVAAMVAGQLALGLPLRHWELPFASVIVALPLLGEAFLLVVAGGRLWEKLDPAREMLEAESA